MGRRYRMPSRRKPLQTKPKHNMANKQTRESRQRHKRLDKGKENYFRYDMEDLLKRHGAHEETWAALTSTLFAKGSRGTIEDAKDFAKEKLEEGILDSKTYDAILGLIDGYATWR